MASHFLSPGRFIRFRPAGPRLKAQLLSYTESVARKTPLDHFKRGLTASQIKLKDHTARRATHFAKESPLKQPDTSTLQSSINILTQFENQISLWAKKILKDSPDVPDVVQKVLINASKRFEQFNGESNIKSWLYRITLNECIMILRARKTVDKYKHLFLTDDAEPQDPEQILLAKEKSALLEKAMEGLADKYRQILDLFYYEGLVTSEIMGVLDIPKGTVGTRNMHARSALLDAINSNETLREYFRES